MVLRIQLLGEPRFYVQEKLLAFPFRKVEALACYLAVERRASREKLADLFWGDREEERASKNLRNALYQLRKELPPGFLEGDRQRIFLGSLSMEADFHLLEGLERVGRSKPPERLESLKGLTSSNSLEGLENRQFFKALSPQRLESLGRPFMEGFSLGGCPGFEAWLREKRSFFSRLYREGLRRRVLGASREELPELFPRLEELLARDDLDEEIACLVMYCSFQMGRRSRMIQVYDLLRERLQEELGVLPSEETREYCAALLAQEQISPSSGEGAVRKKESSEGCAFFGRLEELERLRSFCEGTASRPRCVYIAGEAGVGKSLLVQEFLRTLSRDILVLSCGSTPGGGHYPLLPWNDLLRDLPRKVDCHALEISSLHVSLLGESFPSLEWKSTSLEPASPARLGQALGVLFRVLRKKVRIFLVMEDFQWMDTASLEMFESFLLHDPGDVVCLITARPQRSSPGESLLHSLSREGRIGECTLKLGSFSSGETEGFCRACLPERSFSSGELSRIFQRTEGLPLFLAELLQLLRRGASLEDVPPSLGETIEGILRGIREEERELLECLSIFWGKGEWDFLRDLTGFSEREMASMAEHLRSMNILGERLEEGGKLFLEFRHVRVKEHLYDAISEVRRLSLHRRLAKLLMEHMGSRVWNDLLGSRILSHCRQGGMRIPELDYTLRKLRLHIKLNYELFPLFNDDVLRRSSTALEEWKQTLEQLRNVRSTLRELREGGEDARKLEHLEMQYRSLLGGYFLWWGEYHQGTRLVQGALEWGDHDVDPGLYRDCLRDLCYHAIQIEEGALLEEHARSLLEFARRTGDEPAQAGAWRFLGLARIYSQDFHGAREALRASVTHFEELEALDAPYTLQKAAARSYEGLAWHHQGEFRRALEIHQACLEECEAQGIYRGGCFFHSHAAHAAYDLGEGDILTAHLEAARGILEECQWWRGNGILFSLLALQAGEGGREEEAVTFLRRGDELSIPLKKGYWMALQLWVKGNLKRKAPQGGALEEFLQEPWEAYLREAREIYVAKKIPHMIERIDDLLV